MKTAAASVRRALKNMPPKKLQPLKKLQPPAHVLPTPVKEKEKDKSQSDILLPALPVGSFEAPSSVLRKEADASTTLPAPEPVKRGRGRPPKNALAQLQPSNQPRRGQGRPSGNPTATCTCAICLDLIVEATETSMGDEALFCEGHCQVWLHRRCACVTKARFDCISSSEAPFLCHYCQGDAQRLWTKSLQNEVAALREEVSKLNDALQKAESKINCSSSDKSTAWKNVVKRGSKTYKQQTLKTQKRPPATGNTQVYVTEPEIEMSREKQPVSGKRRIWGTLKQCNAEAVKRAIHQFSTVPDGSVDVRRKYKTVKNAKLRWWHVLTAEEVMLQRLDQEWEAINLQTGWKIEPCFVFKDNSQSNPVATNIASPSAVPGSEVGPASVRDTVALSTSELSSAANEQAGESHVTPVIFDHISNSQFPIDTPADNYFLDHK